MLKKIPIEAIVFDVGMVLLKFDFDLILKRLVGRCKVPASELHLHFWGSGLVENYDRGKITSHEFAEQLIRALGFDGSSRELLHTWSNIFSINPPMVERLMRWKEASVPIYYLSNTCEAHVEFFTSEFEFFDLFDGGVYSCREGFIKPEPLIYQTLLSRYALAAERTLFIDDRPENVQGARSLGIHTIHYTDHSEFERSLENFAISRRRSS